MRLALLRKLSGLQRTAQRTMALCTQVLNPMTGQNEWDVRGDDYDYHQEIANAGFGDMLHDKERNQKYYAALRKTIDKMHAAGREVHVLDIGTGTGILAMMALRAGADTVTACEAFMPMANCAARILQANDMAEQVRLIKKRSTDLKVGEGLDMKDRANLLVTEVLDTELIGEGAIGIYNHAHAELLTEDVVCIPARAACYAQVAHSSLAMQWNTLKILPDLDGEALLKPPQEVLECKGEAALHDVQLSQLPVEQFRPITEPIEIFEFDFNSKTPLPTQRRQDVVVPCKTAGSTDLVFYWWDIKLDADGEITLSCAPFWSHPELKERADQHADKKPLANVVPWRDHWMQAIYYIPKPLHLSAAGAEFTLSCHHDEYSLWFDAFPAKVTAPRRVLRHACSCSLHMTYARSRIGQLNQATRNKRYIRQLEELVSGETDVNVLVLGDGCTLGLATAKMGVQSVICHEPHRYSRRFMEIMTQQNTLTNVSFVEKLDELSEAQLTKITHVVAEPYFLTSILPWDNFYFGTLLGQIKQQLRADVKLLPYGARIFAVPVEFLDLQKIRAPVRECEGFDLTLFDEMVETSASIAQAKVEAQPLWEYPCRALGQPKEVLEVVFENFADEKETSGEIEIEAEGNCNGIALWVDWQLDRTESAKSTVSSGPTEAVTPGDYIKWDMFVRQGVHLYSEPRSVKVTESSVTWRTQFKPLKGQLQFNFEVKTTKA